MVFFKLFCRKGFPSTKDIKPIDILNIITRGTAFHVCLSTSKENLMQDVQVSDALNRIQNSLLELLSIFIIW